MSKNPSEIDPKVLAIISRIKRPYDQSKPPRTFEEFLLHENLGMWPVKTPMEKSAYATKAFLLGSQKDVESLFRDAAPLPMEILDNLEKRLESLETVLDKYADMIIVKDGTDSHHSQTKAFLTEVSENRDQCLTSALSFHSGQDIAAHLLEKKKKTVENATFPGFHSRELLELPAKLEAPPILHRVTKVQDFNPGFKKFWKKIFLSEASVALMLDTFWWIFLDRFQKGPSQEKKKNKDLLFDRMADSFVALFCSINTDVKDKFLMEYPNCLAQAIYVSFCESFPDSRSQFDNEEFKQSLVDMIFEWISGIRLMPGVWKGWNLVKLGQGGPETAEVFAAQQLQAKATKSDKTRSKSPTFDLKAFEKFVQRLGEPPYQDSPAQMSREDTQITTATMSNQTAHSARDSHNVPSDKKSYSSMFQVSEGESHQIGPSADLQRVKFNLHGRSPLVSHYLERRKLQNFEQPGIKVQRTEITSIPVPGPTYRELINDTLSCADNLSKEYQKVCDRTNHEILELEKQKKETNRAIDKLQRELLFTKNNMELKILSEKILELKDRDKSLTLFGAVEEDDSMFESDDETKVKI